MKRVNYAHTFAAIILLLTLVSCGSPYRLVHPHEVIENKDISFVVPNAQFIIDKDYSSPKETYAKKHLYIIDSMSHLFEIHVYVSRYDKLNNKYFYKDKYYKNSDIREYVITKREKETNITYKKWWITYVKGIKCQGFVFSRGFGGSYAPSASKDYMISCGYYDRNRTKSDGQSFLSINYIYRSNSKHNYEQELKHAVKKVISTLKIKNMDTERMKRKGLLYPNKRFKSTKW